MSRDTWPDKKNETADAHRAEEAVTGLWTETNVSEAATVAPEALALQLRNRA